MKEWKVDRIGAGQVEEVLNKRAQEGYEIFALLPTGSLETFLIVACKPSAPLEGTTAAPLALLR